jgi:hypothetical protein
LALFLAVGGGVGGICHAQLDPEKRELLQLGYNLPAEGHAPLAAYAFYYHNHPGFYRTNLTLRLAIAPVYLDSELGFKGLLGEHTDLAVGAGGGGFADSYSEVRGGQYLTSESFTGHGAEASLSVYHRFNPQNVIPLHGILRAALRYSTYERDGATAPAFTVPSDRAALQLRAGVRWGGQEPLLDPDLGMEVSGWYDSRIRSGASAYGFGGDRIVETSAHFFWGRALINYTFPQSRQQFRVGLTAGTSVNADRFSAYRLGAILPLSSEAPLTIPGYYFQEISARRFVLLDGAYHMPLDPGKRWSLTAYGATGVVDYLTGLEQPGNWHSGVGGGLIYHSPNKVWQIVLGYAYGIDAIRGGRRGANVVGILIQYDFESYKSARAEPFDPGAQPGRSRGLMRLLGF